MDISKDLDSSQIMSNQEGSKKLISALTKPVEHLIFDIDELREIAHKQMNGIDFNE